MKAVLCFVLFFVLFLSAQDEQPQTSLNVTLQNDADIDLQDPSENFIADKMPTPIKQESPIYPQIARKLGIGGLVWMKLWVGEDGIVKKSKIVKSTFNQKDVTIDLNNTTDEIKIATDSITYCTVKAAGKWTFSPAIHEGKPVKVWVMLPFKYKLDPMEPGNVKKKE